MYVDHVDQPRRISGLDGLPTPEHMIFFYIGRRFSAMSARPGSLQELSARDLSLADQSRDFRVVELEDVTIESPPPR